jgi:coenzyme Q-binding protein COQ10
MFDLVADMERYPEFVPLCRAMRVLRRVPEPEGVEVVVAEMTVAYKLIVQNFISRVTLDRPNLQILVEYLEGPFRKMENRCQAARRRDVASPKGQSGDAGHADDRGAVVPNVARARSLRM